MAIERIGVEKAFWREGGYSHLQRYLFAFERVRGRVLDVACGEGFGSYILAPKSSMVTGVDISEEAINAARREHAHPNVTFHRGTLDTLPPCEPFDFAISLETIEHVPKPGDFLLEIRRRLGPSGILLISAPNVRQHTGAHSPVENPFHLHEPTYDQFRTWVCAGFEILEEWEQSRIISPQHAQTEALARAGATLGQHKMIRAALAVERALRRLMGKTLPPVSPVIHQSDAMVVDTMLMPLLPGRRAVAHTFLFVARKLPEEPTK